MDAWIENITVEALPRPECCLCGENSGSIATYVVSAALLLDVGHSLTVAFEVCVSCVKPARECLEQLEARTIEE